MSVWRLSTVDASLSGSQELGLAAVAHLSRYRGTSREHTESDLTAGPFEYCDDLTRSRPRPPTTLTTDPNNNRSPQTN